MAKRGLLVPVGRMSGYTVYGQSRGGRYPMVSLPKDGTFDVACKVQFFRFMGSGDVTLEAGDVVIRKVPTQEET